MYSKHITGSSSHDAGEALGHCLEESLALSEGAAHVDVFVESVIKVGDGWKAVVDVFVEPRPKPKKKAQAEPKLTPKPKPKTEAKLKRRSMPAVAAGPVLAQRPQQRIKKPEPTFAYTPEIVDELEDIHQKNISMEHEHHLEDEHAAHEEHDLSVQLDLDDVDEGLTHLYMEIAYEEIYRGIAPSYDFSYVHFIASGSLWDVAQEYHLDLEMHAAANDVETIKNKPLSPELLRLLKNTKADPKNYPALIQELTRD